MSEDWALQHEISCSQRYGEVVRAAGIDSERLDSLTIFELAGHIVNDAEVQRLIWAKEEPLWKKRGNAGGSLEESRALQVEVLNEMNPGSRRAMAERAVSKLNVPEKILTSR